MNISRQDIKNISDVEIAFGTTKCLPEINEKSYRSNFLWVAYSPKLI